MWNRLWIVACCALLAATGLPPPASAQQGMWRRARVERRQQQARAPAMAGLPADVRAIRDVAYGSDPAERYDVYLPERPLHDAPVIFMVHGGGWTTGDKASARVVGNKLARWVPRGFILVSVDYPLVPQATPLQQARDVGLALATAQRMAAGWGGDRARFILMGHSAGAHLVALLDAAPSLARGQGAVPWLGTVALDSASYDVVQTMSHRHLSLYDRAFGSDPADWAAASPYAQLAAPGAPFLAVCSSRREDSCPQARRFVAKANGLGMRAQVLPENLSHEQINEQLGLTSDYTASVEAFMRSLDPVVARLLQAAPD